MKPAWISSIALLLACCMNDAGDGKQPPTGSLKVYGTFVVALVESTAISPGYTSVLGKAFDGPTPASLSWKETTKSGECRLLTPRAPFCEQPCGSGALCVEDNTCQDFPKTRVVGKVSVKGVKTKAGETSFTMEPILGGYQPPGGIILEYPPFAEGDAVTFAAAGDSAVAAFTLSGRGISPLEVLTQGITLADGQAVNLEWTPPKQSGRSAVSVLVDISHHGGIKGKIECEGADDGSLEIPAALVDQLKALGVSGYPKIEITRKATGTTGDANVELAIESMITKPVAIPGLVSCTEDSECPDGQACQADLRCK